jgi:beta-galactosidase
LSKAWFLNYWGENLHTWEDLPTRDGTISTGYKLEWTRWSQMRVTDFLLWQAALVRECAGPGSSSRPTFGGMMKRDVNEEAVAGSLDIVADNIYHGTQDHYDGSFQALQSDFSAVAEAWEFSGDGDQRADDRMDLAEPVSALRWATCARTFTPIWPTARTWWSTGTGHRLHGNQETYWKGILSHDLEPNRAYAEMSKTAHELEKIGPHLVGLKIHNDVAILWSRDSANAISFMPYGGGCRRIAGRNEPDGYVAGAADAQGALRR